MQSLVQEAVEPHAPLEDGRMAQVVDQHRHARLNQAHQALAVPDDEHLIPRPVHHQDAVPAHAVSHAAQLGRRLAVPRGGEQLAHEADERKTARGAALVQLLRLEALKIRPEARVLAVGGVGRRAHGLGGGRGQRHLVRGEQEGGREDGEGGVADGLGVRLGPQEGEAVECRPGQRLAAVDAGAGAQEREGAHARGRQARQLLRDHAAQRDAHDVELPRLRPPDVVGDLEHVGRHAARRVPPQRLVGPPDAAVVEDEHRVLGAVDVAEVVRLDLPRRERAGEAHDELVVRLDGVLGRGWGQGQDLQ